MSDDKCTNCDGSGYCGASKGKEDLPLMLTTIGCWPCSWCNGSGKNPWADIIKALENIPGDSLKITADNFWHKDLAEVEGSFLGREKVTDLPIVNSVDGIPSDAQVDHE